MMVDERPSTRLINSINYISDSDFGAVVVASSHGGMYSAYKAVVAGVRGIILNDAGSGRDEAGVASLSFCGRYGVPAAVVSHMSARIGDVADMEARGTISGCNALASQLGIVPGMRVPNAVTCILAGGMTRTNKPDEIWKPAMRWPWRLVIRRSSALIPLRLSGRRMRAVSS